MTDRLSFSIVLATYGRGRHIRPTIESVLDQTVAAFELIVVGDGCDDDTQATVAAFDDTRLSWRNLPQNTGSQSAPNNEGIRRTRGSWICYIGHDDIWAPDHLQAIRQTIQAHRDADFVVSGCVYYGPPGSDVYVVKGLFDTPDAAFHHFCPPTSLAHRRDAAVRIGGWRAPRAIKPPVDVDFLLRAAHAGFSFASTGRITVHKFAAGHRYLSYLRPGSDEQTAMLRALAQDAVQLDEIVATSKRSGLFMTGTYPDFEKMAAGASFEQNRHNKGISRAALQPLQGRAVLEQTDEPRGLDWYHLEFNTKPFRWSGPNPRPKILIPFTGGRARLAIEIVWMGPVGKIDDLTLWVEDEPIAFAVLQQAPLLGVIVAEIDLKRDDYTILTLQTPMFCPREQLETSDERVLGAAVADIVIEPL